MPLATMNEESVWHGEENVGEEKNNLRVGVTAFISSVGELEDLHSTSCGGSLPHQVMCWIPSTSGDVVFWISGVSLLTSEVPLVMLSP